MDEGRWRKLLGTRDPRFDGHVFVAVTTTGIYCRPSCPARPKAENLRYFKTAAAAQEAGFRACKRCRPDATPGSPEWNLRADLVGRAMRLISDGVVDRDGVAGLASRLGYSARNLHRQLVSEVGAGPLALAKARRAQTARILLETTDLPMAQIAFAAGFGSIRRFNETVGEVFAMTPSALRARTSPDPGAQPGRISVRLPVRSPFDASHIFAFLAARAVPGVEEAAADRYRRTLALPHGPAVADLSPGEGFVRCTLRLTDLRDLAAAVERCRRLLDLDADPAAVSEVLTQDEALSPLLERRPGVRVPGHVDGNEAAVRAVLGQQVSVAAARTQAARLVERFGKPLTAPDGELTHIFPDADTLAGLSPEDLPMPGARARALISLTGVLASGEISLDPGADREEVTARMLALPGIGPWTAGYVRMRALGDPDAFLPTDLGVIHGLRAVGIDPASASERSRAWQPWRAYALQHLWMAASGEGGP